MDNLTVRHNDEEIVVPIDNVTFPEGVSLIKDGETPDGFMPSSAFQSEVDRSVNRKLKSAGLLNDDGEIVKRDDLLADDSFFRVAAQRRGINLSDDLKPIAKFDPEKVDALYKQWEQDKLAPVVDERDTFKREAEEGRRGNLVRDIMQHAQRMGLRPEHLDDPFGGTPPFIDRAASRFEWDSERNSFFFRDASGSPVYSGDGYAGPAKLLEMIRKADKDHKWFSDKRPSGSGLGSTDGRTNGAQVITRKEFDAMEPAAQHAFVSQKGQVVD